MLRRTNSINFTSDDNEYCNDLAGKNILVVASMDLDPTKHITNAMIHQGIVPMNDFSMFGDTTVTGVNFIGPPRTYAVQFSVYYKQWKLLPRSIVKK